MTNSSDSNHRGASEPHLSTPQGGVSRLTVFFLVAVVGMVGFVLGTRSQELSGTLGGLLGLPSTSEQLDLSSVESTYRQLSSNFDGELDMDALVDGASRGLVEAAGDEYTVFMDAEEAEQFTTSLRGEVSGIGAEIGVRGDVPTIIRVIPGSPAEQAGVRPQDRIVRVNDAITARLDASRTAELIRGPAGSTVSIEFLRGEDTVKLSITRATISDPSVDSRLDGQVGILKLRRFDKDTGAQARQAAERLVAQGAKGIVLDMRDNGGGYLEQTQQVAGLWLDKKIVVTERQGDKKKSELVSQGRPILADIPTVVLVNNSSASASEIVAGALQDYDAAVILGEQTFGKGSVQQLIELSGGRMLKVTIARWFTPNGESISEKGITPDMVVELTADDFNSGNDPQLDAAKERLE